MPKTATKSSSKFVIIKNKGYGKALQGAKIYFEGKKSTLIREDGTLNFGKTILELLNAKFDRFRWIITPETDSIKVERGITRVRTSEKTLRKMYGEQIMRKRDINTDIIKGTFSNIYGSELAFPVAKTYSPGTLAKVVNSKIIPRLSSDDKDAIDKFLPDYIASESLQSVNLLNAKAQIKTLKELAKELEDSITETHSESWWQTFIKSNILLIQQGYIQPIEKMNIAIGNTKFPDFSLITHDGYLDILEIKRPNTPLISEDTSRGNYHWTTEMSKAIIQTENYIATVSRHADPIRNYIRDEHKIELQVLRPRGIVLAGNSQSFQKQKEKDDLRLLNQSTKNITFVTYDELVSRLKNYIEVLEKHSSKKK
jgi:hypothetical protein